MSIHPRSMVISIGTGVELGSALVPDVVCCVISSINVVGFAPIGIGIDMPGMG